MGRLSELTDGRLEILLAYTFGFATLVAYFILALVIAICHIEEKTSFGLLIILNALGPLGALFASWAYNRNKKEG